MKKEIHTYTTTQQNETSIFRGISNTVLYNAGAWWIAIILYGTGLGSISSVRLPNNMEKNMSRIER